MELGSQETTGRFTYSIVVGDNDELESARPVVSNFTAASLIPIRYCTESRQNIALARNKPVEDADRDSIALIDDDVFPNRYWLLTLFNACKEYGVDGVVGLVKRHFDE